MPGLPVPAFTALISRSPWPLPALACWGVGWAVWLVWQAAAGPPSAGLMAGTAAAAGLAWAVCSGPWRRAIAAAGFPLSALTAGATGAGAALPSWPWLMALLPMLAAYPLRAWRDAPFFPTPPGALAGLPQVVGTPRQVLDAGCGLGHGLLALRRLWPEACLCGVEWSPLLALLAAVRCRDAKVARADMWAASWAAHDLVYLFQRPESMARAHAKAAAEMAPGSWLVSLEFSVPGRSPVACLEGARRRPLWVYQPAGASGGSIVVAPSR